MKIVTWFGHYVLLILIVALTGCTMKFGMMIPNDRFAYPNSNVEPLGRVTATVSKGSWFTPQMADKQMYEELKSQALKQKGGDMIIDAKLTTKITMYPLLYFYYFNTELSIDGTAAKQTIGRQELK